MYETSANVVQKCKEKRRGGNVVKVEACQVWCGVFQDREKGRKGVRSYGDGGADMEFG